jgi:bifunctional DNA-binding transcriptional regulator/antitoxin component of YhaV-PrlF toxin-antitoxin module
MVAVQVDEKYRVTIPKEARGAIKPGDVLFVECSEEGVLHYAKAENPFDGLAKHAVEEYRAKRTRNLREIAREEGVDLSEDGPEEDARLTDVA